MVLPFFLVTFPVWIAIFHGHHDEGYHVYGQSYFSEEVLHECFVVNNQVGYCKYELGKFFRYIPSDGMEDIKWKLMYTWCFISSDGIYIIVFFVGDIHNGRYNIFEGGVIKNMFVPYFSAYIVTRGEIIIHCVIIGVK